jgi:hypothetical protein
MRANAWQGSPVAATSKRLFGRSLKPKFADEFFCQNSLHVLRERPRTLGVAVARKINRITPGSFRVRLYVSSQSKAGSQKAERQPATPERISRTRGFLPKRGRSTFLCRTALSRAGIMSAAASSAPRGDPQCSLSRIPRCSRRANPFAPAPPHTPVARNITLKLSPPELNIRFGLYEHAPVPETPVDEQRQFPAREDEIRRTGTIPYVQPKAVAEPVHHAANDQLRLRALDTATGPPMIRKASRAAKLRFQFLLPCRQPAQTGK